MLIFHKELRNINIAIDMDYGLTLIGMSLLGALLSNSNMCSKCNKLSDAISSGLFDHYLFCSGKLYD